MAFGRRKNETSSSDQPVKKELPTMPTRFQTGDQRAAGHETTYQASRGGWLRRK